MRHHDPNNRYLEALAATNGRTARRDTSVTVVLVVLALMVLGLGTYAFVENTGFVPADLATVATGGEIAISQ